jgi:hypothetical protein
MRRTARYGLLGRRRNGDILEKIKLDQGERNYRSINKNG